MSPLPFVILASLSVAWSDAMMKLRMKGQSKVFFKQPFFFLCDRWDLVFNICIVICGEFSTDRLYESNWPVTEESIEQIWQDTGQLQSSMSPLANHMQHEQNCMVNLHM